MRSRARVDAGRASCDSISVLKSVRHRALKRAVRGDRSSLPPEHAARVVRIMRELDIAITPRDMALPGYRLHAMKGELVGYWSVRVSANWRILFRMEDGDVFDVDLTDDH